MRGLPEAAEVGSWVGRFVVEEGVEADARVTSADLRRVVAEASRADDPVAAAASLLVGLVLAPWLDVVPPDGQASAEEAEAVEQRIRWSVGLVAVQRLARAWELELPSCYGEPGWLADVGDRMGSTDAFTAWLLEQLRPVSSAPVAAYVASAFTAVPDVDQADLASSRATLVLALRCHGVAVYDPARHTHPDTRPDLAPADVHASNLDAVLDADLIVHLADQPSVGAGKEVAWAERSGCEVLVLGGAGSRPTRMVTGSASGPQEHAGCHGSIAACLHSFLEDNWEALRRHRDRRAVLAEVLGQQLELLRGRLPQTRGALGGSSALTLERAEEILRSAAHLSSAAYGEVRALTEAAALEPPAVGPPTGADASWLTRREVDALQSAAELEGWGVADVVSVLASAAAVAEEPGVRRRLKLTDVESWRELRGGG